MGTFLVAGLVNVEATVNIGAFPLEYIPITYSNYDIVTGASGGAYNVGKALKVLGDDIRLLSLIGNDMSAELVKAQLEEDGISGEYLLPALKETAQSVILYDRKSKRQIFCDLKEVQETEYDEGKLNKALKGVDLVVIQNSNFCRSFLEVAKKENKTIAANVHALLDSDDKYNKDFMKQADILFLSDNNLEQKPYDFIMEVQKKYQNEIIVLGCGAQGAMLFVKKDNFIGQFPAVKTREIVNVLGAGDALFSAFLHFYHKTGNPYHAIKYAILFSSYKIGTAGSANGFMTEEKLEQYFPIIWK